MIPHLLAEDILLDIEDRKSRMLTTQTLFDKYDFSDADEQFFLNHSFPIIYSIWEGFVQTTFQTYIREINKEINRLNLLPQQICKPILLQQIESRFPQFKQYPEAIEKKIKFIDNFSFFLARTNMRIDPHFNTESNVGFKVLNRLLTEFNLENITEYPISQYSLKEELDEFLLKIRNGIAHGENAIQVQRNDLNRAITLVKYLMDLVFEKVNEGFRDKKYLHIV